VAQSCLVIIETCLEQQVSVNVHCCKVFQDHDQINYAIIAEAHILAVWHQRLLVLF